MEGFKLVNQEEQIKRLMDANESHLSKGLLGLPHGETKDDQGSYGKYWKTIW